MGGQVEDLRVALLPIPAKAEKEPPVGQVDLEKAVGPGRVVSVKLGEALPVNFPGLEVGAHVVYAQAVPPRGENRNLLLAA